MKVNFTNKNDTDKLKMENPNPCYTVKIVLKAFSGKNYIVTCGVDVRY